MVEPVGEGASLMVVIEETEVDVVGVEGSLKVVVEVGIGAEVSLVVRTEEGVVAIEEEGMLVGRAWVEGSMIRVGGMFVVVTGEGASLEVVIEAGGSLMGTAEAGGRVVVPGAEDGFQNRHKVWDRMLQGVEVSLGQGVEVKMWEGDEGKMGQGAMDKLRIEAGDKMVQGNVVVCGEEDSMRLAQEEEGKPAEVVEEEMVAALFHLASRQQNLLKVSIKYFYKCLCT